jgi:hypothetical protein
MNTNLKLIGISIMFVSTIVMFGSYFSAMLNGGTLIIHINDYGEGLAETLVFFVGFILAFPISVENVEEA